MCHIRLHVCVEYMMFKEFGLWFPPYKIDSTTKFLLLMPTILISKWHIYSWHRLICTFVWLNIISCQSLSCLTLFRNPSSTWCNTNHGVKLHLPLWGVCYKYYMPIFSCVRWHVHKVSHRLLYIHLWFLAL